jgi:hypothetical protein
MVYHWRFFSASLGWNTIRRRLEDLIGDTGYEEPLSYPLRDIWVICVFLLYLLGIVGFTRQQCVWCLHLSLRLYCA